MKYQDRLDLQKTITKLETNDFDYQDIKSIFIDLREYSEFGSHFQELSHFVAHKVRDKGSVHANVEGHFCSLKYYYMLIKKIRIDFSKPPEPCLRQALLFSAGRLPNDFFREQKIQKTKFIQQIKDNLPLKPKKDFQWSNEKKFYDVMYEVLSIIDTRTTFESTSLIDSFIRELKRNKFTFDENKINKNRLVLMIMVLLNETTYISKALNQEVGNIEIGIYNRDSIDYLGLWINLVEFIPETYITFNIPFMESNLIAQDCCTETLLNYLSATTKTLKEMNIYLNEQDKFDIHYSS